MSRPTARPGRRWATGQSEKWWRSNVFWDTLKLKVTHTHTQKSLNMTLKKDMTRRPSCLRAGMEVKTRRRARETRVKEGSESEQKQPSNPVTQHLCQPAGQQEKKENQHLHPGNSWASRLHASPVMWIICSISIQKGHGGSTCPRSPSAVARNDT